MSMKSYFLMPSQSLITTMPSEIVTVIGSCISVCLWDSEAMIGGMNHYLLPGSAADHTTDQSRGYTAIPLLIRSMINRGCHVETLEAKIFGGCNSLYRDFDRYEVGKRNTQMAIIKLMEAHIPIVARSTGGAYGRRISFNTGTGKAGMQLLNKTGMEINEELNKGFGY
jgi:chemotaxis protein CheD